MITKKSRKGQYGKDGSILRKSWIAIRKATKPKKGDQKNLPKPPTPQELRKQLAAKGMISGLNKWNEQRLESDNDSNRDGDVNRTVTTKSKAGRVLTIF